MSVFLLLVVTTLESFISRLATGTLWEVPLASSGRYVLYVHMYLTILDRDREMLKCSDVI